MFFCIFCSNKNTILTFCFPYVSVSIINNYHLAKKSRHNHFKNLNKIWIIAIRWLSYWLSWVSGTWLSLAIVILLDFVVSILLANNLEKFIFTILVFRFGNIDQICLYNTKCGLYILYISMLIINQKCCIFLKFVLQINFFWIFSSFIQLLFILINLK